VNLQKNEIFPLLGSKDGIAHLPFALCDKGDEILVPDPGYPAYTGPALMLGVQPVYYNLVAANHFKIDLQELEQKVSPRTSYLWVNFPSNPIGQVATLDELRPLVTFAREHNIWLIYDNAYAEITFDGYVAPSIFQIEGAMDVAVEIGSFSKMLSFAGFRMGWIVGNNQVVAALSKVKSQMDSGMTIPLQKLGAYALTHPDDEWHKRMMASYQDRRDIIINFFEGIGLQPNKSLGSLYLWVKIPDSYPDSEIYSKELLEKRQILITPGTAFGKNGSRYVRISFCVNIDRIKEYI